VEREYQPLTFGIGDRLTAVAFDPARPRLLTAIGREDNGEPAQVEAYDLASGEPAGRLFGPEWPRDVRHLALTPDGQRLAVVTEPVNRNELEDTAVEIWDLAKRRLLSSTRLRVPGGVFELRFSPDGGTLAVARWNPVEQERSASPNSLRPLREYPVFLLDGRTGEVRGRIADPKSCLMSRFSPDG